MKTSCQALYHSWQAGGRAVNDLKGGKLMEQNIAFERCIDFLTRMIEKYGDELLDEIQDMEETEAEQKKTG